MSLSEKLAWTIIAVILSLAQGILLSGCATKYVVVPPGKPVIILEEIRDVKMMNENGEVGRGTVPAGYIAMPDPSVVEKLMGWAKE